ncbi:hypothetical protein [Azospirillum ramasamyi]|nr:hypothetical protein [Azospirillum ramasamyi]
MVPQQIADTTLRLFPAMSQAESSRAQQVADDVVARLTGSGLSDAGLSDAERAEACEAALKQLMEYLIEREGWVAEEFTAIARSLGAY